MRPLQIIVFLMLAAVIAYAGYRLGGGSGLFGNDSEKYILSDIYSLVMLPDESGDCEAAVAYREKHVIGTFVAEPIKEMVCQEYYFHGEPPTDYRNVNISLVRLETGEYHWILSSELVVKL